MLGSASRNVTCTSVCHKPGAGHDGGFLKGGVHRAKRRQRKQENHRNPKNALQESHAGQ